MHGSPVSTPGLARLYARKPGQTCIKRGRNGGEWTFCQTIFRFLSGWCQVSQTYKDRVCGRGRAVLPRAAWSCGALELGALTGLLRPTPTWWSVSGALALRASPVAGAHEALRLGVIRTRPQQFREANQLRQTFAINFVLRVSLRGLFMGYRPIPAALPRRMKCHSCPFLRPRRLDLASRWTTRTSVFPARARSGRGQGLGLTWILASHAARRIAFGAVSAAWPMPIGSPSSAARPARRALRVLMHH